MEIHRKKWKVYVQRLATSFYSVFGRVLCSYFYNLQGMKDRVY